MDRRNSYVGDQTLNQGFLENIYSQNGEDGVIKELLARIQKVHALAQYVVEFGAWDGMHLSNTFALVRQGFNAVYIEGDKEKYSDLLDTCTRYANIIPIKKQVRSCTDFNEDLDSILKNTVIPIDYDVLSIDIDSTDLDIWESSDYHKPKIVIIEIDSSFPPGIEKRHTSGMPGSSFTSTLKVGKEKGYTLVCHTGNMIFVRNEYLASIALPSRFINDPSLLFNWYWYSLERQPTLVKIYRRYRALVVRKLNEAYASNLKAAKKRIKRDFKQS